jgi:ketosteroid isomerase-like protein
MTETEATIRAIYSAIESGDGDALTELIDEKVEWVIPGVNRFAGVHTGRDEYFAIVGELVALTGGILRLTPQAMFFAGDRAVVVQQTTAQRDGEDSDLVDALLIDVEDGRVTAIAEFAGNPAGFDRLLA